MKKYIIINLIFILIIIIIPKNNYINNIENNIIEDNNSVISNNINEIEEKEEKKISDRKTEEIRKPIIQKNIFLSLNTNLTIKSNCEIADYEKMLANTSLYEISNSLYESEQNFNINGLYIMGLACLESSYGNSNLAKNRNNLVGWNATTSNPNGAKYFNSKSDCILFISQKIKENYLTENGIYFKGFTIQDVDKTYCTSKTHSQNIINIVSNLIKKI